MSKSTSLSEVLKQDPGDWSVRIALAETLRSEDRVAEAVAVLRENPLSPITPEQSQTARRLLAEMESEAVPPPKETDDAVVDVAPPKTGGSEPIMVAQLADDGEEEEAIPIAVALATMDSGSNEPDGEAEMVPEADSTQPETTEDLDGEIDGRVIFVAEGGAVHAHEKDPDTAQKISALSMALFVHIGIFLLLALVVIAVPPPNPPAFVATISTPDFDDVVEEVQVQRIARVSSSSSSTQPTYTITAVAASDLAMPESDNAADQNFDITLGAVSGNIGIGMSFEEGEMESEVNFFGIRSKGSRIVLVIEAARFMLTDNKGGIPAYDKVKEDIGKMLSGLNRLTAFNIVLFEGKKIATYQDELVAASPSNIRLALEWLDPINKKFESLGIREDYSSALLKEGIEPIPVNDLSHYIKAVQRAMEMDVNTMFLLTSGWVHLHKPLDERELEKFYRDYKWGEKEEAAWVAAVKRAQAWLEKENAARREKGVPQRVIRDWHEIVRELEPNLRRKPGPGYTMEEVEDQVKEASNAYYRALDKKKPEINVVWFIGEDEEPSLTVDTHFKSLTRANRGKMRVLQGMAGLTNVTGDPE